MSNNYKIFMVLTNSCEEVELNDMMRLGRGEEGRSKIIEIKHVNGFHYELHLENGMVIDRLDVKSAYKKPIIEE